jgi:uncharacterized protein YecE (DUF72 family)
VRDVRVAAGTSGYAYKEWKGTFYPDKLPQDRMLAFYGERFSTVEINNTFYRMPKETVLAHWASQVPDQFTFVLKAPQRITHYKRLQDVGDELDYFLRTSSVLGAKLGPTLFQLPPNFKKDLSRLDAFLSSLPQRWRAAVEFRHPSWHGDDVFTTLRNHEVALCCADADDDEAALVPTARWGYLRLRREQYGTEDLRRWAQRVLEQPWDEAFVFFKHEDAGAGPKLAQAFQQVVGGEW